MLFILLSIVETGFLKDYLYVASPAGSFPNTKQQSGRY